MDVLSNFYSPQEDMLGQMNRSEDLQNCKDVLDYVVATQQYKGNFNYNGFNDNDEVFQEHRFPTLFEPPKNLLTPSPSPFDREERFLFPRHTFQCPPGLNQTPPRSRSNSPADGDSGYSSKQLSPVTIQEYPSNRLTPPLSPQQNTISLLQRMSPNHASMKPLSQEENVRNDLLLEHYRKEAVHKYKRKIALLDDFKKQSLLHQLQQLEQKEKILNQYGRKDFFQNDVVDSKEFNENFKQMSMENTLQQHTRAVQESIRETLKTANNCRNHVADVCSSEKSQLTNDFGLSDILTDPRWGGSRSTFKTNMTERHSPLQKESESNEPSYTWSGHLPPKIYKNPIYSNKVFLGGVPWDITEAGLQQSFRPFGALSVEWPGKDGKHSRHPPKGYVYLLFECEKSVKNLLTNCTHDFSNGGDWYYKISSRRMRSKEVQVIPWVLSDSNFVRSSSQRLDSSRTVFVGGLHGMVNAEALCQIMNDLFDGVIYAGIDTDKHKYPIGSGRVTFNNSRSFMKAVQASFIEIRSPKFTKKVQIDPYLEDALCSQCHINPGPFFCRASECFKYYCHSCWSWHHSIDSLRSHRPMTRHSKSSTSGSYSP